jgi:hypothetical protein
MSPFPDMRLVMSLFMGVTEMYEEQDEVFVYTGVDQVLPGGIRRVRIDESVDIISEQRFYGSLSKNDIVSVQFHDGLRKIEKQAFLGCALRRIRTPPNVEICEAAFAHCPGMLCAAFGEGTKIGNIAFAKCSGLFLVEIGAGTEIGDGAFMDCENLKFVRIPDATKIGTAAFRICTDLVRVELGNIRTIKSYAFMGCTSLEYVKMPLIWNEDNSQDASSYGVFDGCVGLTTVELTEDIIDTVSSLGLESWRNDMNTLINTINISLPDIPADEKTISIKAWMIQVQERLAGYKSEHLNLLKEASTAIELAAWKIKLDEKNTASSSSGTASCDKPLAKKVKVDMKSFRKECRVNCGASVIIENVFPSSS